MNVFSKIGISINDWKGQIIYSSPRKKISDNIEENEYNFWSKKLGINKNQIKSFSISFNPRKTHRCGSIRLFFDSGVFYELFVRGIIDSFMNFPEKFLKVEEDYYLLLKGLMAAEGIIHNENGKIRGLGIAYNPHSDEGLLYSKLFSKIGIKMGKTRKNALPIYRKSNLRKLNNNKIFELHSKRHELFENYFNPD